MTPIPPSRASAIASRASVTVSIAAETIGISSAIVRVSLRRGAHVVRQHGRLGRHEQDVVEGEAFPAELLLVRKLLPLQGLSVPVSLDAPGPRSGPCAVFAR